MTFITDLAAAQTGAVSPKRSGDPDVMVLRLNGAVSIGATSIEAYNANVNNESIPIGARIVIDSETLFVNGDAGVATDHNIPVTTVTANHSSLANVSIYLDRVAGLEFMLRAPNSSWPTLLCKGGVAKNGSAIQAASNSLPVNGTNSDFRTIAQSVLGTISIPLDSPPNPTETAAWDHIKLSYASEFDVTLSRLTPAALIETSKTSLRLCGGTAPIKRTASAGTITESISQTILPKYVAWHTAAGYQVDLISNGPSLAGMDQPWLLVWYGNQSHWVETTIPINYSHDMAQGFVSLPQRYAFRADCPILLVFSANPTAIAQTGAGGFDLTLPSGANKVVLLPLYGRARQVAGTTDGWTNSINLPSGAKTLIQNWYPRLYQFPLTVAETYSYNSGTDTATITETFNSYVTVRSGSAAPSAVALWDTWLGASLPLDVTSPSSAVALWDTWIGSAQVGDVAALDTTGSAGTQIAPLSPILGVARDTSLAGLGFSASVVDGGIPTEYGPTQYVDGASSYSWTLSGLAASTAARAAPGGGAIPSALQTALNDQVDALIAHPHWRPWYFHGREPQDAPSGDVYFANPADTLAAVAEIIPLVSGARKTSLVSWLTAERAAHPPETVWHLDGTETGTDRGPASIPSAQGDTWFASKNATIFSSRQWIWAAWGLARYYQETGASLSGLTLATNLIPTLTLDMAEQDWATGHWFSGQGDRQTAVENANRHWAGLAGLSWLMNQKSDSNEGTVRALLAKATIARVAMAHMPRWQASAGLITLPTDIVSLSLGASNAEWLPKLINNWQGFVYFYTWSTSADDPRQVIRLNQYQCYLDDSNARGGWNVGEDYAYVPTYRNFVKPLSDLLAIATPGEVEIYATKTAEVRPHWWVPYADGWLGQEQGLMQPADSLGLFLARAWLIGDTADNLNRYAAYSWLTP